MTVIDERLTAKGFTPRAQVPLVYGMARTIDFYTIHWWGSYGQTHDGVNNFFVNGPGLTSAHFVASADRLNCLVNPWDAAWHAGNAYGNAQSVGIECRPEGSDGDYMTVAELLRFLFDTYGRKPLRPHKFWQATACPGNYDLARLEKMALAYKPDTVEPPVKPIPPKVPAGDIVQIGHEQQTNKVNVALKAGIQTYLKDAKGGNWNLATEGLAYYDIDLFLQGTGLAANESIEVQAFIVTGSGATQHRSGFFTQSFSGDADGVFKPVPISIKTPLLSTARLEVAVKSSGDATLTIQGCATYAFKK